MMGEGKGAVEAVRMSQAITSRTAIATWGDMEKLFEVGMKAVAIWATS
jgi:hypothetical protein